MGETEIYEPIALQNHLNCSKHAVKTCWLNWCKCNENLNVKHFFLQMFQESLIY